MAMALDTLQVWEGRVRRPCCGHGVSRRMARAQVERVDHGVRSLEDASVVARLARQGTPLTVCPLSNLRMQIQAHTHT